MVVYTQEHKTSAVGLRREQYLPLVIPWEGVVSEDWISVFCPSMRVWAWT